jgi:hypothetical protein
MTVCERVLSIEQANQVCVVVMFVDSCVAEKVVGESCKVKKE